MTFLLVVVALLFIAALIVVPIVLLQTQKKVRERKNYERGLKMVPLLIHLPPASDDTEAAGRDLRDLIDENISKAQVIYNIIASTAEKGFKTRIYGQRHFAFEIVGSKGFAYFYAAVPLALVEVVKQAIVSAYPSARLEEVAEHNVFSPVGKISGTAGGELHLKENFAYPIATYQDLKRDAMQALLNSLSTLEKEDGAGIQILMRPAESSWRKNALAVASSKRKGEKNKKGGEQLFSFMKQFGMAFIKPPEEPKKDEKSKDLSSLEQATLDAIEDKTRHAGYEVLIRVVVSSNISHRAQAILNNIVASFSLFDAPGKNGFKYSPAKNIDEFITNYILRMFPQNQNKDVLNSVELATIFHFPDQRSIPTSQLERQESKQVDGPRNVPETGLLLGYNVFRGVKKPIRLAPSDRQRHMYAVGQTGTGKSTYLENLALQDMMNGDGFAFVDPHGDTAEKLLSMVPRERTEDVIYFCPAEMDYPMGLNLFEYHSSDQKDFLIQEALNMLYKLYDPQHQGIMGPRYEHLFRNAALTVMADPNGGTFVDIPKLFRDPQFVKQKLQYVKDQNVIEFWQKEMPQSQRSNEFGEVVSWFVSKFGAFLSNEMMRNIIGQTKSSFDLRDIMDNRKILLVNLSKGRTGELNSKLLGMVFVMKFQAAAMSRANIPESERRDFALYVDEFQNFSTDSFATILSEARKYHLNLIVANQFTTQLTDEVRDAVFGNIGTIVAFRVGQDEDAEALAKRMRPAFDTSDLLRMPNYNAAVRTLIGGVPTQPFSMSTLPPLGNANPQLASALKQLSAAKYGKPKAAVEKEIFDRLATKMPPMPPQGYGAPSPYGPQGAPPGMRPGVAPRQYAPSGYPPAGVPPMGYGPAPAPAQPRNGGFLDEWMNKRNGPLAMRPSPWANPQTGRPVAARSAAQPPVAPAEYPGYAYGPMPPAAAAMYGPPAAGAQMPPTMPAMYGNRPPQPQYWPQQPMAMPTSAMQPTMAQQQAVPAQLVQRPIPVSPTTGDIPLGPRPMTPASPEDIYIDQDGNIHRKN
ncbi:MAG TPA: TraM recognition domain-containing protein [Candidatus Saccharimonadales bacterium]|nr:TraM recognition domain-containing protein [Candidatus Saccharimonadales bacterium]